LACASSSILTSLMHLVKSHDRASCPAYLDRLHAYQGGDEVGLIMLEK
jgi:hypothetical protein